MKSFYLISYIFIFFFVAQSIAQDPITSHVWESGLSLNPAFAGYQRNNDLTINSRAYWFGNHMPVHAIYGAYKGYFKPLKGGVGVDVMNYSEGKALNKLHLGLSYAYHFQVSHLLGFSGGLKASVFQHSLQGAELVLPNMIDHTNGEIDYSMSPANYKAIFYDFSFGIIAKYGNNRLGFSVDHLTQPGKGFQKSGDRLPVKYTLHYNKDIVFFIRDLLGRKYRFKPYLLYQYQQTHQLQYGMLVGQNNFELGMGLRQNLRFQYDALMLHCSVDFSGFSLLYSYDFELPTFLKGYPFSNAHEVTFCIDM